MGCVSLSKALRLSWTGVNSGRRVTYCLDRHVMSHLFLAVHGRATSSLHKKGKVIDDVIGNSGLFLWHEVSSNLLQFLECLKVDGLICAQSICNATSADCNRKSSTRKQKELFHNTASNSRESPGNKVSCDLGNFWFQRTIEHFLKQYASNRGHLS